MGAHGDAGRERGWEEEKRVQDVSCVPPHPHQPPSNRENPLKIS